MTPSVDFLLRSLEGFERTRLIALSKLLGIIDHFDSADGMSIRQLERVVNVQKNHLQYICENLAIFNILEHKDGVFFMNDEMKEAMRVFGGHANYCVAIAQDFFTYEDVCRTGQPIKNVERNDEYMKSLYQSSKPTYTYLFDRSVPQVDGLQDKLIEGIDVLEIGFGAGFGITTLAKHYPQSRFYGCDIDDLTYALTANEIKRQGVENVSLLSIDAALQQTYDFMYTSMSAHEFDDLVSTINSYLKQLNNNGCMVVMEVRKPPAFNDGQEFVGMDKLIRMVDFDEHMQGTRFYGEEELESLLRMTAASHIQKLDSSDHPIGQCYLLMNQTR